MPRLLKLAEKNGDQFLQADDDEQLYKAALLVVEERLTVDVYDDGSSHWYHDEESAELAKAIIEMRVHDPDEAGRRAWQFLQLRSEHEYEGVYLEHVR